MRSQSTKHPGDAAQGWEPTRATDFAITTVNVPDRLDMQEVRARADEDDDAPRRRLVFDTYWLRVWIRRLAIVGVIAAAAYYAYLALLPLRDDVSAAGIAARLTRGLGQPVRVGQTEFRFTPTPRLVLQRVDVADAYHLTEVSLYFNWNDALRALRGGSWIWGEAAVAPLKLDGQQGLALMRALGAAGAAVPSTVSTIRFESIEFADMPLLPGRYELVARRGSDGRFAPVTLAEIGSEGRMKLVVSLGSDDDWGETVNFQLDAANWALPVGSAARWSEVVASGRVRPNLIEVDAYSLAGAFGVVQGLIVAARDAEWAVTGTARAPNLDLESVMLQFAGKPAEERPKGQSAVPMHGTAVLNLLVAGRGDTLTQAIEQSVAAGPLQVRWATLNGINLGYAATRGGASGVTGGGITRFSELDAAVILSRAGLTVADIRGRAGAMATRGEIRVAPDLTLSGALRVDLGAQRVQAPINVRVRGTALQPQFGR
ncbi:MAG: hypothetical protein OHK0044_12350 [Burkholderiaceae bacterium]